MTLPAGVRREVERALSETDSEGDAPRATDPLTDVTPVGGGCINHGARVRTSSGRTVFVKWNATAPPGMFAAEASGLAALAAPSVVRVPGTIAHGGAGRREAPAWLILEHIESGTSTEHTERALGRGLAALHRDGASAAARARLTGAAVEGWGWGADNWIGSLPQPNDPMPDWADFWRERRLAPQLRMARDGGHLVGIDDLDRLLDRMGPALAVADEDGPSLLHGDLWGGNVMTDAQGDPVLIDPAVYRGHRDVDLAMTELFGGFSRAFREAYEAEWPLAEGYREVRRGLYQLYYLLVHVNLFGAAYESRTVAVTRAVLSGL